MFRYKSSSHKNDRLYREIRVNLRVKTPADKKVLTRLKAKEKKIQQSENRVLFLNFKSNPPTNYIQITTKTVLFLRLHICRFQKSTTSFQKCNVYHIRSSFPLFTLHLTVSLLHIYTVPKRKHPVSVEKRLLFTTL